MGTENFGTGPTPSSCLPSIERNELASRTWEVNFFRDASRVPLTWVHVLNKYPYSMKLTNTCVHSNSACSSGNMSVHDCIFSKNFQTQVQRLI